MQMALGKSIETLQSSHVENGPSTGLVIDVKFLEQLKLKDGKTTEQFAIAINDWAENQVNGDLRQDDGGLNAYLKKHNQSITNNQAVDGYFDEQLLNDYQQDRDDLILILREFAETSSGFYSEVKGLKDAINFQLTTEGKKKFDGQGAAASGQQQTDFNLNNSSTGDSSNSNQVEGNPLDFGHVGKNNFISENQVSDSINYTSTKEKNKLKNQVENQLIGYVPQNIYLRQQVDRSQDKSEASISQQKRLLRRLAKGSKDESRDIIEVKGDDKANKPDTKEKSVLREYFAGPLKNLVVKDRLDNPKNLSDIWEQIVVAYNQGTNNLLGLENRRSNKSFWETQLESNGISDRFDKKMFIEEMAKLSALYVSCQQNQLQRFGLGSYTSRVISMIDNTMRSGGVNWNGEDSAGSMLDVYNNNNNNLGSIHLDGGYDIIIKDRKDGEALKGLASLAGGFGDEKLKDTIERDKIMPSFMQKLLNSATMSRDEVKKFSFEGGEDLYRLIRDVKVDDSGYGQLVDLESNASLMLAEGCAFRVSNVDMYNIKVISDKGQIDTERFGDVSDGTRFMNFLADFTNSGGVGTADHAVNGGEQLMTNYRLAVNELKVFNTNGDKYKAEDLASRNILTYMIDTAARTDVYVAEVLKKYRRSDQSLVDIASDHPALVVYMQNILKYLPSGVDLKSIMARSDTFSYSNEKKIAKEYLSQELKDKINEKAINEYNKIKGEISNLPGDQQAYYDYITPELLKQHISNTVSSSLESGTYGAGAGIALKIVNGLQINLSLASGPGGLVPGVGIGLSNDLGNGRGIGVDTNILIPGTSAALGKSREGTRSNLANTLSVKGVKTYSITAQGGISVIGVSAGMGYEKSTDIVAGITDTTKNIHKEINEKMKSTLTSTEFLSKIKQINIIVAKDGYLNDPSLPKLQNEVKSILRNKLTILYSTEDTDTILAATENLYNAIVSIQYDGTSSGVSLLADYLAEQWKDKAIQSIKNTTKLTGWGMGIHAFLSPSGVMGILPFSLKFSKFDRGYAHFDTAQSLYGLKQAEFGALDNRILNLDLSQRLDYMNGALQACRMAEFDGMGDFKGLTIPQMTVEGDGKFIKIPKELYLNNILNIKISPIMKGKIAKNVEGDIYVPVDKPLRFSSFTQQGGVEYVLNIGSTITSPQDIHLIKGRDGLLSEQGFFVDDSNMNNLSIDSIEQSSGFDMNGVIDQLTIRGFENLKVVGENTFSYSDENGTSQTVSITNGLNIGSVSFEILDRFGLKLTRSINELQQESVEIDGKEKREKISYDKGLSDDIISGVSKKNAVLENFEGDKDFKDFLDNAINNQDNIAVSKLASLRSKIPELVSVIDNGTDQQKSELVCYMMQSFALEPEHKDYKLEPEHKDYKKDIVNLMDQRDDRADKNNKLPAYQRLSNSGNIAFLTRNMFKQAYQNTTTKVGTGGVYPDVLGYTAFYRKDQAKKSRGYAMTLPGYTKVLGNQLNSFDEATSLQARERLSQKIANDAFAKSTIKSTLDKRLSSLGIGELSDANIQDIILGKETVIGVTGVKIRIESNPIFYLLAECANESVGLQIDTIRVSSQDDSNHITLNGDLKRSYKLGIFASNDHRTTASAQISQRDFNLGIAASKTFNGSSSNGDNEYQGGYSDPDGEVNITSGGGYTDSDGEVNTPIIIPTRSGS